MPVNATGWRHSTHFVSRSSAHFTKVPWHQERSKALPFVEMKLLNSLQHKVPWQRDGCKALLLYKWCSSTYVDVVPLTPRWRQSTTFALRLNCFYFGVWLGIVVAFHCVDWFYVIQWLCELSFVCTPHFYFFFTLSAALWMSIEALLSWQNKIRSSGKPRSVKYHYETVKPTASAESTAHKKTDLFTWVTRLPRERQQALLWGDGVNVCMGASFISLFALTAHPKRVQNPKDACQEQPGADCRCTNRRSRTLTQNDHPSKKPIWTQISLIRWLYSFGV